ncbi:g8087 [Coccomyxa viridis]|uniref:Ribosome-recycling factor, chloroplastic n=1 Tax=Coccomyxa viridis TaxID=1274662 RepID=A0ABP1FZL8_9CHLO
MRRSVCLLLGRFYIRAHPDQLRAFTSVSAKSQGGQSPPTPYLQQAGFAKKGKQGGRGPVAESLDAPADGVDLTATKQSMDKAISHLQEILTGVRVGRASAGLLDALKVDLYGERLSMKAVGSVSVRDTHMLSVSPFDPQALPLIEKAIRDSPMKLNPRMEGQEILVPVPRPDADTVKAMGKLIKQEGEGTRMAIRAARRTALEQVKRMPSKDAQRQEEKKVQKLTDGFIKDVDSMCEQKEAELQRV